MDSELVRKHDARVEQVEAAIGLVGFVVGPGVQLDLRDRYVLVEIDDADDCSAIGYRTVEDCVRHRDEECGVVGIYDIEVGRWYSGKIKVGKDLVIVSSPIDCSFGGGA